MIIAVYQQSLYAIAAYRCPAAGNVRIMGSVFTSQFFSIQAVFYRPYPQVAFMVFGYGTNLHFPLCSRRGRNIIPNINAKPFPVQQVDTLIARSRPNILTFGIKTVYRIAVDGRIIPLGSAADKMESIGRTVVNIESVQRSYNYTSFVGQMNICDIRLTQHAGTVSGIAITLYFTRTMIIPKQSPVTPHPQKITVGL